MRLTKFSFFLLFALLFLFSCKESKQQISAPEYSVLPPSIDILTNDDTLAVIQLANTYCDAFSNKDYSSTANMLYKYEGDSVRPLTSEEKASYITLMSKYPNYGCKFKGLTLRSTNNNRLSFLLQVMSSGNIDTEEGVMKLMLNPVLQNGEWFLTLFDPNAEGTKDIYHHE